MSVVKTVCAMCGGDYCGIDVVVEDGGITGIRGCREHPHNRGWLCPQAKAAIEQAYDPRRLDYPMPRRRDSCERISWDEALDIIAEQLRLVKERHGAQSLAVFEGEPLLQYTRDGWARTRTHGTGGCRACRSGSRTRWRRSIRIRRRRTG